MTTGFVSAPYAGADDVAALQNALSSWRAASSARDYCHPGDVPHRLFNGNRGEFPLAELVRIWRDDAGQVVGFVQVEPYGEGFGAFVAPFLADSPLVREMLEWGHPVTRRFMDATENDESPVYTDTWSGDALRPAILAELGYEEGDVYMLHRERALDDEIPAPQVPAGFTIRSASMDDAAALAAVHASAFGSEWTEEEYRDLVMTQPGYVVENERVVVAPDGRFAAFTVCWVDARNGVGYFEPVGTHKAFQRKGFGRALLLDSLRWMQGQGLSVAEVHSEADDERSNAFYEALGLRARYEITEWGRM